MTIRCFMVLMAVACAASAADIGVIDEIVAKVNGDIVTRSELERGRRQLEAELRQRGTAGAQLSKEVEDRSKDILRDRIDQLLLAQKGRELNITVDSEVSKYLAELQLRSNIADPEKFQSYVREQTGQTFEDYKAEIRNGLLTQRVVRQEVGGRISIPRAELQKYYEEHKKEFVREDAVFLREIVVSTEGKDEKGIAAAEKKAKDLSARAKKGEKFPELARDNSDSATAKDYGALGIFKRGDLNKTVEEIVFNQDRNFVSDPVRTDKGFVILKVEERYRPGQATFEEVENEIMERLYAPRMQPAVREYLTRLRQEAFLEIKEGFVDTSAAPGKNTAWSDPAQLKPETVTKEEVAAKIRKKRLLWMVPLPGTQTGASGTSTSR